MLGINFLAPYSLSILAFVGAVGSFVIVFAISQTGGRVSPTRLILAGVATAYVPGLSQGRAATSSDTATEDLLEEPAIRY